MSQPQDLQPKAPESQPSTSENVTSIATEQINMDALKTKPQNEENQGEAPKDEKKEEPGFFRTYISTPIVKAYNATLAPLFSMIKQFGLDTWDSVKRTYDEIKAELEAQGAIRFMMNKAGKAALLTAKIAVITVAALLVNELLLSNFGFGFLSLNAVLISLGVAIVCFGIVSYMNQKETKEEFTMKEIGSDIAHSLLAA